MSVRACMRAYVYFSHETQNFKDDPVIMISYDLYYTRLRPARCAGEIIFCSLLNLKSIYYALCIQLILTHLNSLKLKLFFFFFRLRNQIGHCLFVED